jgi:hypothetical protein
MKNRHGLDASDHGDVVTALARAYELGRMDEAHGSNDRTAKEIARAIKMGTAATSQLRAVQCAYRAARELRKAKEEIRRIREREIGCRNL